MKNETMKMALAAVVAMAVGGQAIGADAQSFSLSTGASASHGAASVVKKVMGKGSGSSKVEALKEAYRDAVERAVGLYMDAEQMMKNEQLLKDQILTQSNAYIEKYELLKEDVKPNGFVAVQILAEVKTSALTRKMSDVMPRQTFTLGNDAQNIHAMDVTKEKRDVDAEALLQNVLDGLNPVKQLISFSLASPKAIRHAGESGGSDKSKMYYRFKFVVDEQKYYGEFLPPLLKVLDQISLKPPKDLLLSADVIASSGRTRSDDGLSRYLEGEWDWVSGSRPIDFRNAGHTCFRGSNGAVPKTGAYVGRIRYVDKYNHSWTFSGCNVSDTRPLNVYSQLCAICGEDPNRVKGFRVLVITKMNASRSIIKAREYVLSRECAVAVLKWQSNLLLFKDSSGNRRDRMTSYNIIFTDKNGEEVAAQPVSFKNEDMINSFCTEDPDATSDRDSHHLWHITPLIHGEAASLEEWIGFNLPQNDLPNIKSVTVELAE